MSILMIICLLVLIILIAILLKVGAMMKISKDVTEMGENSPLATFFGGGNSSPRRGKKRRVKKQGDGEDGDDSGKESGKDAPRGLLKVKNLAKHPRTKSESNAIKILEGIIGAELPTVNPRWLVWKGRTLELDGYSHQKKIALEFSGPLHTKWFPEKEPYEDYFERVIRDVVKKRLCKKNGITLIVIDMSLPSQHWGNYMRSRLFDAKRYDLINIDKTSEWGAEGSPQTLPTLGEKPHYYIDEQNPQPFRNPQLEEELGLDKEYIRASKL